jgi:hypothetical protein
VLRTRWICARALKDADAGMSSKAMVERYPRESRLGGRAHSGGGRLIDLRVISQIFTAKSALTGEASGVESARTDL